MGGSLVELLASDLIAWFDKGTDGVPRRVQLWLDPNAQFQRLAPKIAPLLDEAATKLIIGASDDQVQLKIQLMKLDLCDSDRAVVYLPGFTRDDLEPNPSGGPPGLWAAYEYRYKGCVWGLGSTWQPGSIPEAPSLLNWLRSHGIRIADDSAAKTLTAGGPDSLLARYAIKHLDRPLAEWPRPLRVGDVKADLGGDPRDELRRLIINPGTTLESWGPDAGVVRERVRDAFGLDLAPDVGPEKLADDVVIQLAMSEAWQALGEASGFPFLARTPVDTKQRKALAKYLREDVLPNEGARAVYRIRINRLESNYDISAWARKRAGSPLGLPRLSRARWRDFLSEFDTATSRGWKDGRDFLMSRQDAIDPETAGYWNTEGDGCHWATVADLLQLVRMGNQALEEAASVRTPADAVSSYADRWYVMDRLHLDVRDVCSRNPHLESIREVADHVYFEYVSAVNDRFTDLVEREGKWPPAGLCDVTELRARVWLGEERRAVIVSDALRWDLGREIADQMADGCEIEPVISTLPSITPYGMTAMLPLREGEPVIKWAGGPTLKDSAGRSLAERSGRKGLLEEVMQKSGSTIEFLEMNALLKSKRAPDARVVVVFDTNIDAQGHKAVENFPPLAQKLVADIRRSIEKLHSLGIPVVHVLTDHGFLLMPPECVDSLGQPEAPVAQCTKRETRWAALKPDATLTSLIRIPLPMARDQGTLGVPRGVRTLIKAEPYIHGGMSLQECVLPYLAAAAVIPVMRVKPILTVTQPRLTTGTVSFSIRPGPVQQPPLGGVAPVFLRLLLETEEDPPRRLAQPREEELRQDVEEIKGALFLEGGHNLEPGTLLRLRCLDRDTGEELAYVQVTLGIPWE